MGVGKTLAWMRGGGDIGGVAEGWKVTITRNVGGEADEAEEIGWPWGGPEKVLFVTRHVKRTKGSAEKGKRRELKLPWRIQ